MAGNVLETQAGSIGLVMQPRLPQTPYVAKAGLEPLILLSPSLECWDYKCVPPCLALKCCFKVLD